GLALAVWATLPAVLGWSTTVVMSGSMAPAIMAGDAAVVRPIAVSDLEVGQIVLVPDPDHEGRLRLHRIEDMSGGELVLRGDANTAADSSLVAAKDVLGVLVLRVPAVGMAALLVHDTYWWALALLIAGSVLLVWLAAIDLRPRYGEQDVPGWSPNLSAAYGFIAVVLLAASALGPQAGAAVAVPASNTGNSFGTNAYYTCNTAILAATPYVYFDFDEASGTTALDSSGNGRNGQYQGGVTLNQAKACARDTGAAVLLNGTTGFVRTANTTIAAPTTYTISMWFKTTSVTGGRLLGFGNQRTNLSTTFDRHVYLTASGQVVFGANPGLVTITSPSGGYNNGQWHHFAATRSASGMALYVDGVLQGSNTMATTAAYNGFWRVGWDTLQGWPGFSTSTPFYIAATLDEAVVYTTALTQAQVTAQYLAGK
ncbi:MAG: LamG-like jellyroll fold domain-containing protein, partial [Rhodoglobus sp.]